MNRLVLLIFSCVLLLSGCREPFNPEIEPADLNVLVVEGYLDTDGLASKLKLSYTRNIQTDNSFMPSYPTGNVVLKSESGEQYPLTELGSGEFEFAYDIPENQNYRLYISTIDGKSYTSELIRPILTPEIIDVGFVKNELGVEVYLTTKGDENADDFLWTFEETYAFRPKFPSYYKFDPETADIVYRDPEERIDLCYRGGESSDLILETSSRFEDQFVFRQSITQILDNDERLGIRYSILISQKALDKKASEFWEILRKNTDDIGSIFSPLPSNIGGNIKNDQNPDTPVVGFVSLGTIKQRRLYIAAQEVAPWIVMEPAYGGCFLESDTIPKSEYAQSFASGSFLPVIPIWSETSAQEPLGYRGSVRTCADCTLRGTNVKPDFWED